MYLGLHTVDQLRQVRYPSLASVVLRDTVAAQLTAEEIRVMYVALTRAREHLILIGSARADVGAVMGARWANHVGPLPPQTIRAAQSPLDWLLPVAAIDTSQNLGLFAVTGHDADAMKALAASAGAARPKMNDALARLQPLDPPPPDDAASARVLEQLRYVYPHAAATTLAAARSVTSWTKNPAGRIAIESDAGRDVDEDPTGDAATLELPRFLAEDVQPRATDLGSFTHTALQHLDFSAAGSAAAIGRQIETMIERKLLTAAQAKVVDLATIEWMMATELGALLKAGGERLSREIPVYQVGRQIAGSTDRADDIMLRGRLDAYLDTAGGGIVIDYKTDRVSGQSLDERSAFYRGQLIAYSEAMKAITGKPTIAAYLVFLNPRKVVNVM